MFLLGCSAFFSGSETALFSLNRLQVHYLEKHGSPPAKIIANFLNHPSNLLVTILLGNQVVNILAASTAAVLCDRVFGVRVGTIVATVGMTFTVLICGEITPKIFAVQNPVKVASWVCRPLLLFSKLVFPVRIVLTVFADTILHLFGSMQRSQEHLLTEQEFRTLLDVSEREGESNYEWGKTISCQSENCW